MTHAELCEIAVKWLKRTNSNNGHGCHVAVAEVKSGWNGEVPDAIGFRRTGDYTDGCVVVEVKVSRSDFLSDFKKAHRSDNGLGNWRYYMTPQGLIKPDELPPKWGLLEVNKRGHVKPLVGPVANTNYKAYHQLLRDFRHESNHDREMFLMVKLLARIEDAHSESSKIKEIYRANKLLAKRNAQIKKNKYRDWQEVFKLRKENENLKGMLALMGVTVD